MSAHTRGRKPRTAQPFCTNCGVNLPNPGKSWCQSCWLQSLAPVPVLIPVQAPVPTRVQARVPVSVHVPASAPAPTQVQTRVSPSGHCPVCKRCNKAPGKAWCKMCFVEWTSGKTYNCACGNPIVALYLDHTRCYKCQ
jgi:hypothetical protein